MKKLLLTIALLLSAIPVFAAKPQPSVQDTLSKATVVFYAGEQVCKWSPVEGFFGDDYAWGCKFVSEPICTATVIKREDDAYLALTAGHCIEQSMLDKYYVSDLIEDEPVLRHAKVLKSEFDDRYDYAVIEFTSSRDYPVVELNGKEDGPPEIGTELLNVNFSYGLGKQVVRGVVTSGLVNVDDMKKRYLTTLQTGPGSSGSAVVDAKTGKIVGVLELGFPRSAMGAGVIPTGKNLFNFMEDDTAGLLTKPAVGQPPQPPTTPEPSTMDLLRQLWTRLTNFVQNTWWL